MRFDALWVNGVSGESGDLVSVADAVAAGHYRADDIAETKMRSVSVLDVPAPEAAVTAGAAALTAGVAEGAPSPSFLIHSYTFFQGISMWPTGCWIANQLFGADSAIVPFELTAYSNSMIFALATAGRMLAGDPAVASSILLTCADRFTAPGVDRWTLSSGMVFGDGAAAALVSNVPGRYQVLSVELGADAGMEPLFRGDEGHSSIPAPVDMRARNRAFFRKGELSPAQVRARAAAGVRSVVSKAIAQAGIERSEIAWVIPPFVGERMFNESFVEPLWDFSDSSVLDLGLRHGHMGPVDQMFALHHLEQSGQLLRGRCVLFIGTGFGFTFSAAVLRVAAA
ncbi:3-oxoacyl-[acyl-carrier-protein] synthase III C-terminal domain-containing protein [Nocardia sp. NPDC050793]|uniref:3-oxoacyl-[acyl-carrier-protein] synthase III C-terminal domain-containing protein n=1 Tax=Nocardia sp. NPDC050793 TaxID=3155159 RepID=UPI0033CF3393